MILCAFLSVNAQSSIDDAVQSASGNHEQKYVGTWRHNTTSPSFWNSTLSYSNQTDAYIMLTFVGIRVSWTAEKKNTHGIVAVSLDGGPEQMIDLYSATQDLTSVYTSPSTLEQGTHTLKIRVTGTKNSSSTGFYIVHDVFSITQYVDPVCHGDFVLSSQAEVDAFSCTEVIGSLMISGDDITNLNSLSALRKVTGNFFIMNNSKLQTLDGLSALDSVTVDLLITNNTLLSNINALSSLNSAGGVILDGSKLSNLDGFSSLEKIEGPLYIANNNDLLDITGFSSLRSIGGLRIENNMNLNNISGFDNLTTAGQIDIVNNPKLGGINGFSSLVNIESENRVWFGNRGDLLIEGNDALTNIQGFLALASVQQVIRINRNNQLSNLDGFPSLRSASGFILSDNSTLSTVNGFNQIDSMSGPLIIENNYKLTDINGFSSLKSADYMIIGDNFSLTNLDGFSSLAKLFDGTSNGGELNIRNNSNLNSINGFVNLTTVSGIGIDNNPKLVYIKGFNSLLTIKNVFGDVHGTPGYLSISENVALTNLQGFLGITYLGGLRIYGNNSLPNLDGLSNLSKIGVGFGLTISNNAVLESVDGLSALKDIEDQGAPLFIDVTQNPLLTHCCGLHSLLERLADLYTLESLISVGLVQIFENGGCTVEDITACGPQKLSKFTLIELLTGDVLKVINSDSVTVDLADPDFSRWAIKGNTFPAQVGSVEFIFDNKIKYTDNEFPYTFSLSKLKLGSNTIKADVYSESDKKGKMGIGRSVAITVINSAAVVSFDVVNTSGNLLMNLHDGDKINTNDPAFQSFSIQANTGTQQVSNVKFWLNNRLFRVENVAPYALNGDVNGVYNPWNAKPGAYTLAAIPYVKVEGKEYAGKPLKIDFKVVSENIDSARQFAVNSNVETPSQQSDAAAVSVYPIPVETELRVKIDDQVGKDAILTIRNIQGHAVYTDFYSKSQNINMLNMQPGIYFLQVVGNSGFNRVVKFIKK